MSSPSTPSSPGLRPVNIRKAAVRGLREGWDHLGLVCATSLSVFAATAAPLLIVVSVARVMPGAGRPALLGIALLVAMVLHGPLFAGAHLVAHKAVMRDEPSYADFWVGVRSLGVRALLLAAIQWLVAGALVANLLLFAGRSGTGFKIAGAVYVYLLLGWLTMVMYQWPLLVASSVGIITREDGSPARLVSIFRNSFLMLGASPGASAMALLMALVHTVAMLTGVGAAMLGAGFHAAVATRLARAQLERFGVIPEEPDPAEPLPDTPWQVPKE